jgi:hypothetical protein
MILAPVVVIVAVQALMAQMPPARAATPQGTQPVPAEAGVAAQRWAKLTTANDHGRQWDMWTAKAQQLVPRDRYIASHRCTPPAPYEGLRVDALRWMSDTEVFVTYRAVQPRVWRVAGVNVRAGNRFEYELYQVLLRDEVTGEWRHMPLGEPYGKPLVDATTNRLARCGGHR